MRAWGFAEWKDLGINLIILGSSNSTSLFVTHPPSFHLSSHEDLPEELVFSQSLICISSLLPEEEVLYDIHNLIFIPVFLQGLFIVP
jgi:hypothetical protein